MSTKEFSPKSYGGIVRCADTHPILHMDLGEVHGGAASAPLRDDLDIYVSLDVGTANDPRMYPWNHHKGPMFIFFRIPDMSVPSNPEEFVKMVAWLRGKLEAGKKVHVGCFAGHGRTGMVLAALVKEVLGEEDAITYVRENYCKKAVESAEQVYFLKKYFGIKPVLGSKTVSAVKASSAIDYMPATGNLASISIRPQKCRYNIWGV